jgi:tripartite-type tricarboxylate transporter receptor subunit TctC
MKKIIAVLFLLASQLVVAEPIELVVPYAPGGTSTQIAHLAAEILTEKGYPAFVKNMPGASSVIGANYVAKSKADGNTLFLGSGATLASNLAFPTPGIEYNENSFVPIVPLGQTGWTIYVSSDSPIHNYEQFKFYVKANPDKFNLAFWNINYGKLLYHWAEREGLPKPMVVLYKGAGVAALDVAGGSAFSGSGGPVDIIALYRAGKIRVLAAFNQKTVDDLRKIRPDDQTKIVNLSIGRPDLDYFLWYGLYAPTGTPKELLIKYNKIINDALKEPKFAEKRQQLQVHQIGGTTEMVSAWQQKDSKFLREIAAKYKD